MVIVTATRNDLRDEFAMADEAFALSPISASAAPLGEADFDAIREAFMETSRGRWFLAEYARRNRSADTAMVLDAVARIEQTIETQQQAAPADALPKALAAIRKSLIEARTTATAALDKRVMNDALVPIHNGVRIIREISWRWREIGGDSRICDILDSQADAIEKAHSQLAARDDMAALHSAFSVIETTLDELWNCPAPTAPPSRSDAAPPETINEIVALPEEAASHAQAVAEVIASEPEKAAIARDAPVDATGESMTTNHGEDAHAAGLSEQDTAHDDAVLDMIALEMGAPDLEEPETGLVSTGLASIERPETPDLVPDPEPIADNLSEHPDREPEPEANSVNPAPASLGASLLASGVVSSPTPRSDPMAPFKRMTQAEKIAFFS
ncbi:conserved hypothetical protein [Nitrobacter winogradskyi Nb-255]|uniref:Uncharacterized protein n=2 Tax=Nitrobacter winogradskyi TaxID=913 RepID=Q3STP5_NITWN|nr:conserved hypothetical protein [Nitrobacter winogradskyi Nb-255]